MDAKIAVEILKQVGLGKLGYYDGCLCAHTQISGVSIDVSCRKSDGAKPGEFWGVMLRVHSGYLGSDGLSLLPVAEEVISQIKDSGYPIMVRFCDYRHDKERLCVYCDKPRADYESYLCEDCKVKDDPWGGKIAEQYQFPQMEIVNAAEN